MGKPSPQLKKSTTNTTSEVSEVCLQYSVFVRVSRNRANRYGTIFCNGVIFPKKKLLILGYLD